MSAHAAPPASPASPRRSTSPPTGSTSRLCGRSSRRLGYRDDGTALFAIRGAPLRERRFRLTREEWASHRLDLSITVTGLEPCLPFFGAEDRSE
ncbi:hypothetical protein [Nocardiopsis lambiniae]|uniref:Uncharacterized protein n=1 Tax=Nocardiopsis lambiniae TaxID=3075539 RepID=A0ABU2M3U1_9ACTN|nr:hypothetical protein [Nocardiopsis sp. DSM 44743]MDT0326810.1 hypothetical protein [Nocardiopsis sp. DSM 44743]